jgi:cytochrome P450
MSVSPPPTDALDHLDDDWYRHHFDCQAPVLGHHLHEILSHLRSQCPVARSDRHGGYWVVSRYEDVYHVAEDWQTFSSAEGLSIPALPIAVRNIPIEIDPPQHRAFKRIISRYLTHASVLPWEDRTRELVTGLIDGFIETGKCDFIAEFAFPLPALSLFGMVLNAPPDELDYIGYLASKAHLPEDPDGPECWKALSEWVRTFVESRRHQPPVGDVVDAVIGGEVEGRAVTNDEVIGTIQNLILGGLETTASALGMTMIRLCEHPEIPKTLQRDPTQIPAAIEELLRLDGPLIAIARTAVQEAELGGARIEPGDKVLVYFASANRDTSEFPDPETFDPNRQNRHLAFGAGPHRCVGSNLARMNMRIALEEIVARLDDLSIQEGTELHFHATSTRAPREVPICFTPGRRLGALT